MSRCLRVACVIAVLLASPARAQFGGFVVDTIKDRVRQGAEDEVGKQTEDAARGAIRGDGKKNDAPPAQPAAKEAQADPKQGSSAPATPPPEVYGNRYDFVPGDKVLAYDDFSDTDVGEYPAKWTIKEGGGNAVEVVEIASQRFMKTRYQGGKRQEGSLQWLRYQINGDLPKKFTIELDADVRGPFLVAFPHPSRNGERQGVTFNLDQNRAVVTANATGRLPFENGVRHVAIAISGTQMKIYVGGERVVADPDALERPLTRLGIGFWETYNGDGGADPEAGDHQMITSFRLAEGGKDAKSMLAGGGRIVTHGILFDTGSDLIKPESGPTLRSIHALLAGDPALRFRVEGHTDDQGGAKVNGPLSDRRATAVKAWFVKQGIAESRLAAKGLGATKPIDSNETAEGRANNRRVEFVSLK
jgi:outer membrane protein OmpA-like peptidoglycan-associated protein